MEITLRPYAGEQADAAALIQQFWKAHNDYDQSQEDALADLAQWTAPGHRFYFICEDAAPVGFVHLGSRGCEIDWLEDIFVLPERQNRGIGSRAIRAVEEEVRQYSESLYIEAAARNRRAIALYRTLGYNCLNTVTVRKDFDEGRYDAVRTEKIYDLDFEIRAVKPPQPGADA